jgi:hypothetical protein
VAGHIRLAAASKIDRANTLSSCNIDLRQRCLQSFGELPGVVIGPEVHEVEVRLVVEHVVVDRRDFDPVLAQCLQHRVHLLGDQHEVAGDRRLAAARWLKIDCIGRAHRRRDLHPARPTVHQPADIRRQLLGFRSRQQHAVAQGMQKAALADPFFSRRR